MLAEIVYCLGIAVVYPNARNYLDTCLRESMFQHLRLTDQVVKERVGK